MHNEVGHGDWTTLPVISVPTARFH